MYPQRVSGGRECCPTSACRRAARPRRASSDALFRHRGVTRRVLNESRKARLSGAVMVFGTSSTSVERCPLSYHRAGARCVLNKSREAWASVGVPSCGTSSTSVERRPPPSSGRCSMRPQRVSGGVALRPRAVVRHVLDERQATLSPATEVLLGRPVLDALDALHGVIYDRARRALQRARPPTRAHQARARRALRSCSQGSRSTSSTACSTAHTLSVGALNRFGRDAIDGLLGRPVLDAPHDVLYGVLYSRARQARTRRARLVL